MSDNKAAALLPGLVCGTSEEISRERLRALNAARGVSPPSVAGVIKRGFQKINARLSITSMHVVHVKHNTHSDGWILGHVDIISSLIWTSLMLWVRKLCVFINGSRPPHPLLVAN